MYWYYENTHLELFVQTIYKSREKYVFKVNTFFFNRRLEKKKRKTINTVSDEICFNSYQHNNNKKQNRQKQNKKKIP